MNGEFLIPVALFAMIFGIFYIRSRENMAMIERGINPRQTNRSEIQPAAALRNGLLLLGAGLGLLAAYLLSVFVIPQPSELESLRGQDIEALYFALVGVGSGLGLILSYAISSRNKKYLPASISQERSHADAA